MDITIRKARETDILAIAGIYDRILTKEEAGGATIGWVRGVYPTESFANKALAAGDLFVLEDGGKICATARINQEQVPEYAGGDWLYGNAPDGEIMVLHTLVVDPQIAGYGYGKAFVSFYEQYAKEHNCPYLRMDTNAINTAARRFYAKLGFPGIGHRSAARQRHSGCSGWCALKRSWIFDTFTERAQENTG